MMKASPLKALPTLIPVFATALRVEGCDVSVIVGVGVGMGIVVDGVVQAGGKDKGDDEDTLVGAEIPLVVGNLLR